VSEGAVDRKSMGKTVADRSSNETDILYISCDYRGGYRKAL
jgi:hypothetical protein